MGTILSTDFILSIILAISVQNLKKSFWNALDTSWNGEKANIQKMLVLERLFERPQVLNFFFASV